MEKYKQRLMTDKEFAKQDKEKRQVEKGRAKRKKMIGRIGHRGTRI